MKRHREWILLAASVGVSIIGVMISRSQRPPGAPDLAAIVEHTSTDRVGEHPEPMRDAEIERFRSVWPEPSTVREEVRDDPHVVPPSLLRFARALGGELEHAHADPEFALRLLASLEDCVRSTEVIESARAVCLRQSKRIPGFHPEDTRLPIAAARVHEAAPKRVLDIAEAVDSTTQEQ